MGLSPALWKAIKKQSPWLKQLFPHQVSGLEAILSIDGFAALFEQRTGKTWVTGAVLEAEREITHDVLLVGPLTNLESTWAKFLKEKMPWYSVHRKWDEFKKDKSEHRILLLNYEALTPLVKKLRKHSWDRMVYDEAQRLRNRGSRSSRDAALMAASCKRRLVLTGTPIDQNPRELWAVMRFVAPYAFGTRWKDFEDNYLQAPSITREQIRNARPMKRKQLELQYLIQKNKAPIREDRIQDVADLVSPHALRITKEEAGIERAKKHKVRFNLDPDELKKYRRLEKTMVVKHRGVTVKTPLKITQIGKLQQITGGHIKDEEGVVHRIGTSKRRKLRKLIDKHVDDEPFVIFCKYVWEVHALARMLERGNYGNGARLWGKVKDLKKDKRRTNMLLAFQRGEFDWMVCQQRTGGVGVDLYRARKFFVYSMGHSFIDYDQMLSRGDFLEQNEPANFFFLLARQSIDTDIDYSVEVKKSISDTFYDRLT